MRDILQKAIYCLTEELDELQCSIKSSENQVLKLSAIESGEKGYNEIDHLNTHIKSELQRNIDTLNLQLEISKYLKKYLSDIDYSPEEIEKEVEKQQDCYFSDEIVIKTESGELPYNEKHPLWGDQEFLDEFIQYLIEKENFELCEKFKSIKNKNT